jgi:hypothetical protein
MIDRYTKAVLTVIAVCLVVIIMRDIPIVKQAAAQSGGPVHVVVDSVMSYAFQYAGPLHVNCDSGCR